MFSHLDRALRQLLIEELPISNNEVNIEFDQPRREWSGRLNRPTLNLFLYDIRENKQLRQTRPAWEVIEENGSNGVTRRRRPVRVDLHYMITAWATTPEDEHRLLGRTLMVLFRIPELPETLLPQIFRDEEEPVILFADQDDILRTPADIWGALDNELRPSIPLVVTIAMNPYTPVTDPLVRDFELRMSQRPGMNGHS